MLLMYPTSRGFKFTTLLAQTIIERQKETSQAPSPTYASDCNVQSRVMNANECLRREGASTRTCILQRAEQVGVQWANQNIPFPETNLPTRSQPRSLSLDKNAFAPAQHYRNAVPCQVSQGRSATFFFFSFFAERSDVYSFRITGLRSYLIG